MSKITVGIQAVLKKDGVKDIDLVVHQYYVGHPSPCVVIRDGDRWGLGGNIETIEEILELEVGKSPDTPSTGGRPSNWKQQKEEYAHSLRRSPGEAIIPRFYFRPAESDRCNFRGSTGFQARLTRIK